MIRSHGNVGSGDGKEGKESSESTSWWRCTAFKAESIATQNAVVQVNIRPPDELGLAPVHITGASQVLSFLVHTRTDDFTGFCAAWRECNPH